MNKRLLATALLLVMAISLCGCGEKDKGDKKGTTTSATTTTTTATTTTKTVETEPQPEPVKTFDLEGFEMGEAKQIGENKNLSIVATMDMGNLKYNGEEKNSFEIRKITDDNILLSFYFSDDDENLTGKLVSIDKETYEFIAEIDYDVNTNSIQYLEDGIVSIISDENHHKYTIYDYDLNVLNSFESETYSPYMFTDINTAYYLSYTSAIIYRYDVKTATSHEVSDRGEYYVSYIASADKVDGEDIVILHTVEEDHKTHNGVLNADTGEIIYFGENGYVDSKNGIFSYDKYDEGYFTEYYSYATSKDNAIKMTYDMNERYYVQLYHHDNKLIYYTPNDDTYSFEIVDMETGKLIGTCSFDVKEILPDEDEVRKKLGVSEDTDISYDMEPNVSYETCFLDDDTLIMVFDIFAGYKMFLTWDVSLQDGYESILKITDCDNIETCYDESSIEQINTILQPSEVSEKYKPLREKADKIEEKYGIEILIENESVGYMGEYILENTTSNIFVYDPYDALSDSLDCLDKELARYPEGFLEQVSNDGCKGYRFILTGRLTGLGKDNAGGFKYAIDGDINIVITAYGDVTTVIHHELSHSIDHYVEEKLEGTLDFSDGWDKLNPQNDIWYSEIITPEKIYAECIARDIDPSGAYYFSEYGHTNATEDRAEIFRAVMTPENYVQPDFERSPFIKAKINYYAECIRLAFDGSENWGEMPWEKYLD